MPRTIYDSQLEEVKRKKQELKKQLEELRDEVRQKNQPTTMPGREEASKREKARRRPRRKPEEYSRILREEKKSGLNHSALNSYWPLPKGVHFETQHENEKILMLLRQHPIVNLKWIGVTILLVLAPILLSPVFPFFNFLPASYILFIYIAWIFVIAAYVIESALGWYYNIYIITDERFIDVDFFSMIHRKISEAKLDRIEDITARTAGIWGSIFDFGTVTIQTAAKKRKFNFTNVKHPTRVSKFLNELMVEEEQEKLDGRAI